MQTFPFSRLDELFFHIDQPTDPFSLLVEVRVDGHFSSEKTRAAIATAMRLHPLARVRQQPWSEGSDHYAWEVVDDAAPALRTIECPDDAAVEAARRDLLGIPVPLNEAPPFRALLAHHPAGDSLVLNVNHVAADGMGAHRLMLSILRAYAGIADPVPGADPVATRDVGARTRPRNLRERAGRVAALARYLLDSAGDPPARIATKFGETGAGIGFESLTLEADALARLDAMRPPGTTLNDLLSAALHLAIARWNAHCGQPANRVTMMMPMSLRDDTIGQELVGNYSPWLTVASRAGDRGNDLATATAYIAARTQTLKEQRSAGILTDLLELAGVLPGWARRRLHLLMPLTGNFVIDTTVFYNLGRLPPLPDPGGRAGRIVDYRFNPPARMPLGVSVGAATLGDTLHLAFRYRREQFDHVAAKDFVTIYRDVLLD